MMIEMLQICVYICISIEKYTKDLCTSLHVIHVKKRGRRGCGVLCPQVTVKWAHGVGPKAEPQKGFSFPCAHLPVC